MIAFLKGGGITMGFLGICSILAIAVILEKSYKLRHKLVIKRDIVNTLDNLIEEKLWKKAENFCVKNPGLFTNVVLSVLENKDADPMELRDAVEDSGRESASALEKRLPILSTVAMISPLLGLFGTVMGMIKVFNIISIEGTGTQSLSAGIGEALITTATGLAIAIPSLVAYNIFNNKVTEYVRFMEKYALKLTRKVKSGRRGK